MTLHMTARRVALRRLIYSRCCGLCTTASALSSSETQERKSRISERACLRLDDDVARARWLSPQVISSGSTLIREFIASSNPPSGKPRHGALLSRRVDVKRRPLC